MVRQQNTLQDKADFEQMLIELIAPLAPHLATDPKGHLKLGSHGTVYTEPRREVEAFLRPLWGLGPYWLEQDGPYLKPYLQGIIAGTDPQSPEYWGNITDFDQLIVEMASLSLLLLLNKEKTWDQMTDKEQQNLAQWLAQVNHHRIPDNNWHFFRVLVNVALKKCGQPFSAEQLSADLTRVDEFYVGEGWYYDGVETQVDYYVSFAIHYYSLIYCVFMAEEDPERVAVMRERATKFAQTYKYWFDADGEALPFGRSLTYRFSQVAFFSALVFADLEALPWGEIKGLITRHLQNWWQQDMFTTDKLLSVGYHYQNLVFAEGYNGPGSPYWALKTFLLLAVPRDHPFWQVPAQPLQIEKNQLSLPVSRNFYQYNATQNHLQAFPAGQFINFQSHASAKYSKFVYSTKFGFSVPKADYWYYEGAFDSTLALAEDDHYFRTKSLDTNYQIAEDRIIHWWQPWSDVLIKSTIIPLEGCHIRIHELETQRQLFAYEGGFTVPFTGELPKADGLTAQVDSPIGRSFIENVQGFTSGEIVKPEPNTNLFFPATLLPCLKTELGPGNHCLAALVSGTLPAETWQKPQIEVTAEAIIISQGVKKLTIAVQN